MSLQTPSKIRTLQRKLYCKAKDDHVRTRGTRVLANEEIFGRLGVLRLRSVHLSARP
ncbi:MAG TPA: hypothetical protein VE398_21165 [Acidobacteriota bacterium]|nr:hypothetical protein [Acidobacteriota bacterium]